MCKKCDYRCATCGGEGNTNCMTCNKGFFLNKNTCA